MVHIKDTLLLLESVANDVVALRFLSKYLVQCHIAINKIFSFLLYIAFLVLASVPRLV